VCRAAGKPFAELLSANRFGIRLGDLHHGLRGEEPGALLPVGPLRQITLRHTVGLLDPLVEADIPPGERVDDGLPQSLAASIQAYGLKHFKIKLAGDGGRDGDRLRRVAEVIRGHASGDYAFSLDANEQFRALADFRRYWEELAGRSDLQDFLHH